MVSSRVLPKLVTLQRSNKEEAQCRNASDHRIHAELALFEQVRLIAPKLIRSELVGRFSEVIGECRNRTHIAARCTIGIITMLEFLQHHLA